MGVAPERRRNMADATDTLNGYSAELKKCQEELEAKYAAIKSEINQETQNKSKTQNDLRTLTEQLSRINDSLGRKVSARNEYDTTIQETEAAYLKILESSQTLDHVMKRQGGQQ